MIVDFDALVIVFLFFLYSFDGFYNSYYHLNSMNMIYDASVKRDKGRGAQKYKTLHDSQ